jgi:DNA-binding transcriptional LysR family regulator
VAIARILELDAMLGTLDFVARTDWMTILPGIMMAVDDPAGQLKVNPIDQPEFTLDLVLIEPSRRAMSEAASAFLALLQTEAVRLNKRWELPPDDRA